MAVLLALVAVGLAVVLGLALSATRDAAVSTGDSLVRTAAARSAAAGAYDIAIHVLSSNSEIAAGNGSDANRSVLHPFIVGNCSIQASMTDLETGMSPTTQTLGVAIVATATVDGVTQSARGAGRVPWSGDVARADLDLSEFAILGQDDVDVEGESVIDVWRSAPLAALAEPIAIATTARGAPSISSSTQARGFMRARPGNFALTQEELDESLADKEIAIPESIHVPRVALPPNPGSIYMVPAQEFGKVLDALGGDVETLQPSTSGSQTGQSEGEFGDDLVAIGNELSEQDEHGHNGGGGQGHGHGHGHGNGGDDDELSSIPNLLTSDLNIRGAVRLTGSAGTLDVAGFVPAGSWRTIVFDGDLTIDDARISISVPSVFVVYGDLRVTGTSEVELAPGANLSIYVGGDTLIDHGSYLGPSRNSETLDASGSAEYSKTRVLIYGSRNESSVIVRGGSIVKGELYAPDSTVEISENAAVYGRVLGDEVLLDDGRVFYDPALNTRRGWLNPTSGLWQAPNVLRAAVRAVEVLDDASLAAFTEQTGVAPDLDSTPIAVAHVDAAGAVEREREVEVLEAPTIGVASVVSLGNDVTVPEPNDWRDLKGTDVESFTLYGTARDFREGKEPGAHPDFSRGLVKFANGKVRKLVHAELDGEMKPRLASTSVPRTVEPDRMANGTPICWIDLDPGVGDIPGSEIGDAQRIVDSEDSFAVWFRDKTGVNVAEPVKVGFTRTIDGNGRIRYVFDSRELTGGYYPIDDRLLGNPPSWSEKAKSQHNTGFTVEFSAQMVYRQDEKPMISVASSDDLWVFVDGRLVIDLGGMGENAEQVVYLDRVAQAQGWPDQSAHDVRIFLANRSQQPSLLRMVTNFVLLTGDAPVSTPPGEYLTTIRSKKTYVQAQEAVGTYREVDNCGWKFGFRSRGFR